MPIYRYRCPDCRSKSELILPMQDRDNPPKCECGGIWERVISVPIFFKMKQSGKDLVRDTLNREHKILPPKQVEIMAGGLEEPEVPITGRGFG